LSNRSPPFRFPNQTRVWIFFLSYTCIHTPHSSHLPLHYHANNLWQNVQMMKTSLTQFSPGSVSSFLCPNVFLSTLLSHTPYSYRSRRIAYYSTFNFY
jgi:hypothetical protein